MLIVKFQHEESFCFCIRSWQIFYSNASIWIRFSFETSMNVSICITKKKWETPMGKFRVSRWCFCLSSCLLLLFLHCYKIFFSGSNKRIVITSIQIINFDTSNSSKLLAFSVSLSLSESNIKNRNRILASSFFNAN